ncbi:flavin reductase family protein [Candidatus Aerophobetes bacterium]|nr:flavin reductase family protein [Candidatus Aerophobetes bacterium]
MGKWTAYLEKTFNTLNEIGLLLVSGTEDKPNVMTIGWAVAGIIWEQPVLCVLVRPSRYTYGLIEKTGQFTINVPPVEMKDTVLFCGTVSGKNHDKFREKNLTPVAGKKVKCPVIKECLISYECRVIHKNDVIAAYLIPQVKGEFYPQQDYHRIYFGQILEVYSPKETLI